MIGVTHPRLFLRNLIPEDLEVLYDYRNNEGCARYQHWRQGYAYELLCALLPAIQKAYPQTDIVALVEKENVPSIALLQKCGFVEEGFSEKINSCIFVKLPVGPSAPNSKEARP